MIVKLTTVIGCGNFKVQKYICTRHFDNNRDHPMIGIFLTIMPVKFSPHIPEEQAV
jgi:hypothetical protein